MNMRFLQIIGIFLAINLTHAKPFYTHSLGKSQNRDRRSNIYQFLRSVLASSGNNYQQIYHSSAYPENYPDFRQYPNFGRENIVVNFNQPASMPTTIINNPPLEILRYCPCEMYVRGLNNQLECLCLRKIIYSKCMDRTVCVLKRFCGNGLLFDTQILQHVLNYPIELCDESTHTCCLPITEVRQDNGHGVGVVNNLINSTVDHLNNTVQKYVITGNVFLNNENLPTQEQSNIPPVNQFQPGYIQPNQYLPSQPGQNPPERFPPSQYQPGNTAPNSDVTASQNTNIVKTNPVEEKNPVQLNSFSTTLGVPPSRHTNSPGLVRPTRPPVDTASKSIIKAENMGLSSETTSTEQSTIPANISETSTDDILDPNVLASIFGTNSNDLVFPGLSTKKPVIGGSVNLSVNRNNNDELQTSVGVSIIENAPSFVQSNSPPPEKSEIILRGKIEKLRNSSITNATTAQKFPAITQRIQFHDSVDLTPTVVPSSEEVQEVMFIEYMPPGFTLSNFTTSRSGNPNPILKACPSALKCVQNMYCTPEGFVSTVPVFITTEEEERKNLLLNCGDEASGRVGKCCFDRNT